ncbi:MAG TPA: hypothetical protein DHV41_00915 [Parachlamydiales bacterium]|nr:hypothetical protein [Parachlamydiales bacterium]
MARDHPKALFGIFPFINVGVEKVFKRGEKLFKRPVFNSPFIQGNVLIELIAKKRERLPFRKEPAP